jgi:hypothetical protein
MRKLLVLVAAAVALFALQWSPAVAGGWAVPSFDPLPPVQADTPATIGLTILQHGVHPVDVDGVALVYVDEDGVRHRFAAVPDGATGHHVAEVTLPAGTYTWSVEAGWFPERDLGTISVDAAPATMRAVPSPGGDGGVSATRMVLRIALPVATLAAVLLALSGGRRARPVLAPS